MTVATRQRRRVHRGHSPRGVSDATGAMTRSEEDTHGRGTAPSTCSSDLADDSDASSEWEDHGDVAGEDAAVPSTAVYVQESSGVQVGPRTVYQAPVTINQHVHVARTETLNTADLQQDALKSATITDPPQIHTNGFVQYECRPEALPQKEKWSVCRTQPLFWGLMGVAALISIAVVITVYSLPAAVQDSKALPPTGLNNLPSIPPLDDDNPNRTLPNRRKIFSKQQWGGYEAKSVTRLEHPTKYVVISHTAGLSCFESKTCSYYVRNIQDFHHSLPAYDDIGYNFLIGGDGNVYEGRGWDFASMHSGFVNKNNIAISFIGNFVKDSPTYIQMNSCEDLIELGVKLGKLDTNYKVVAHNQTYNTISPGPNIYSIISKWPHFYVPSADDPA